MAAAAYLYLIRRTWLVLSTVLGLCPRVGRPRRLPPVLGNARL